MEAILCSPQSGARTCALSADPLVELTDGDAGLRQKACYSPLVNLVGRTQAGCYIVEQLAAASREVVLVERIEVLATLLPYQNQVRCLQFLQMVANGRLVDFTVQHIHEFRDAEPCAAQVLHDRLAYIVGDGIRKEDRVGVHTSDYIDICRYVNRVGTGAVSYRALLSRIGSSIETDKTHEETSRQDPVQRSGEPPISRRVEEPSKSSPRLNDHLNRHKREIIHLACTATTHDGA
jgi:hypothetical protein